MARDYGQYCAIAQSLDLLGGRWTLLIIRELLVSPRRFTDLAEGLPGIGTNLLSDRLRSLTDEGIVRQAELPPPANVTVYELTERGRELEPVLLALARWGQRHVLDYREGDFARPAWAALAMRSRFRPEEAEGVSERYEFRVDDDVVHVMVEDGEVVTGLGRAEEPDLVLETDAETFIALASGEVAEADAIAAGRLRLEGAPESAERLRRLFRVGW